MKDNRSFFDAGVYIASGMSLSQILYGILGYGEKAYAAASLTAVVALAAITFEMVSRYKNSIK